MDFSSAASTWTVSSMDNSTSRHSGTLGRRHNYNPHATIANLVNFKKPILSPLVFHALLGVVLVTIMPKEGLPADLASI